MSDSNQLASAEAKLAPFVAEVASYFMAFLNTDFKRGRGIPKRNTNQKTKDGHKVGFDLATYPKLKQKLAKSLLDGVCNPSLPIKFSIKKGEYTSGLVGSQKEVLYETVDRVVADRISAVCDEVAQKLQENSHHFAGNLDAFSEASRDDVQAIFEAQLLLSLLAETELDESLHKLLLRGSTTAENLAQDIADVLFSHFANEFTDLLGSYFAKPAGFNLKSQIGEIFDEAEICNCLQEFFSKEFVGDAYLELQHLERANQINDKTEFYLYFFELTYQRDCFPVIYLPVSVMHGGNAQFQIEFEQRLFINTKAIKFVVDEINRVQSSTAAESGQLVYPSDLDRARIVYLSNESDLATTIEGIVDKLTKLFAFGGDSALEVANSKPQKISKGNVSLTNRHYFFVADKSDESLINDYEKILQELKTDGEFACAFSALIRGFVRSENPRPFEEVVHDEWNSRDAPQKLAFQSPVPLNDEQKQVLIALNKPDCRHLILDGPPGTGKSHTITAIICEAVLNEQSVLVLSDKQEALDVILDKIRQTLKKVRREDDFQNPILRLGRGRGNKFSDVLSAQSISQIRDAYRAQKSQADTINTQIKENTKILRTNVAKNIEFYVKIDNYDLAFYAANLGLENEVSTQQLKAIAELDKHFARMGYRKVDLVRLRQIYAVAFKSQKFFSEDFEVKALDEFEYGEDVSAASATQQLKIFADKIESLNGMFGYLFKGGKITALIAELQRYFPHFAWDKPQHHLPLLRKVHKLYSFILKNLQNEDDFWEVIKNLDSRALRQLERVDPWVTIALGWKNLNAYLRFRAVKARLGKAFRSQPDDQFFESNLAMQDLNTLRMRHLLNDRIINYVDNYRAESATLKSIIAKKSAFPKDLFANLKKAFPCILAGIREYAEYIPLEKGLFDLVIIDEASQVSIAQALPALIRGKKIIILGDEKQFSNVKSSNASTETNEIYKKRVNTAFEQAMGEESAKRGGLDKVVENFDIRKSILGFMESKSNYRCELKKHLRCYPEIISYSNMKFYGGGLQCLRVRDVPIADVIKFDVIPHDGKLESIPKTNEPEADFIVAQLRAFKDAGEKGCPTIGIITPNGNQFKLLLQKIEQLPERQWLVDNCKLKVMTFDSCQGEERDHIFYSMVATRERDTLNHIFPAKPVAIATEEGSTLRAQRLNVGFSRAKNCVHFILSKPVEEYFGAIGEALRHYRDQLHSAKDPGNVDPNSPMEKKVYAWVRQTQFYQDNSKQIELIPQFPIGQLLRQLDPGYSHPLYRVDFLLSAGEQKIVIEYDGFEYHFENSAEVNAQNYENYMSPADCYRQKVLESYGYQFLRINRFNIGRDPVQTLNQRLEKMVKKTLKLVM